MNVPQACKPLADQVAAAHKQLEHIFSNPNYHQGPHDPHPGKPDPEMAREAQAVEAKIRQLTGQLNACLKKHGVDPTEICTFSGTARLSSPQGKGHSGFKLGLEFLQPHHKHFFIETFPDVHVDVAGHTLTITQPGGGNGHFDKASGKLDLHVELRVDAPSPGGHMMLPITLSTESSGGSRMDSHGAVKIAGTGTGHGSGIGFPDT